MRRRTTIEIDDVLLERAKKALGSATARATVEEALRRVADAGSEESERRAQAQRAYLADLERLADADVLQRDDMWR